jgi:hypothetical protein
LGPSLTSWGWFAIAAVVNVNDLLNDHVVLDLECLDRTCAITWACPLLRRR